MAGGATGRRLRGRTLAAEYRQLLEARLAHLVPVDQPLVLITQLGRSGGSLLMRLFDGHPQCHAVPHELGRMCSGLKHDFDDAESAWQALTPRQQKQRFAVGYRQTKPRLHGDREKFAFLLPPELQRAIFDAQLENAAKPGKRRLVDAYMTSYFNAWLDNRNLHARLPKRWVTGFEPGAVMSVPLRRGYRGVYPDGRVISIIRDPLGWYASARRWRGRTWGDRVEAMDEWTRAAEATFAWRDELGDRFLVLTFADLVGHTETTMRHVAAWLGIEFVPELVEPTFNGLPIRANSSFSDAASEGISSAPLERGEELDEDDAAYVRSRGAELYERVAALAGSTAAAVPTP